MRFTLAALAAAVSLWLPPVGSAQIKVPPGGVKLPKGQMAPLPGPTKPRFPKKDAAARPPEIAPRGLSGGLDLPCTNARCAGAVRGSPPAWGVGLPCSLFSRRLVDHA